MFKEDGKVIKGQHRCVNWGRGLEARHAAQQQDGWLQDSYLHNSIAHRSTSKSNIMMHPAIKLHTWSPPYTPESESPLDSL